MEEDLPVFRSAYFLVRIFNAAVFKNAGRGSHEKQL